MWIKSMVEISSGTDLEFIIIFQGRHAHLEDGNKFVKYGGPESATKVNTGEDQRLSSIHASPMRSDGVHANR